MNNKIDEMECERHRKVVPRLPGKGNSNFHGARPIYQIIPMIEWTSRLSIKDSLSVDLKCCTLDDALEKGHGLLENRETRAQRPYTLEI